MSRLDGRADGRKQRACEHATTGYLLRDHGTIALDPASEVADHEPVVEADIAFAVENGYNGRIWNRGAVGWASLFLLDP